MAEQELEDIAKNAPQQAKEEPKKVGTLESVVDESLSAVKYAGTLAAGLSFPFMFSGDKRSVAMVNAYPLAAGSTIEDTMLKKPINPVKSMNESFVGAIIANPLASLFKYIESGRQYVTNYAGVIPGGATAVGLLGAGQAAFIGVYMGLNHVVQNLSFKGLYNTLKEKYWQTVKNTWKYVLPLSALNVLYIYKFGILAQMLYSSAMSFLFRLVGPKQPGASLSNLYSELKGYAGGAVSATGKLATNTVKGFYDAIYGIGSGIRDTLYKAAPPPAPSPAPARPPAPS